MVYVVEDNNPTGDPTSSVDGGLSSVLHGIVHFEPRLDSFRDVSPGCNQEVLDENRNNVDDQGKKP